jgi:hypothetical protein
MATEALIKQDQKPTALDKEARRLYRLQYYREWRRINADKVRQHSKTYYRRHRMQVLAKAKATYATKRAAAKGS